MINGDTELALLLKEMRRVDMPDNILSGESMTETFPGGSGAV